MRRIVLLLAFLALSWPATAASRPNVVVFLADDFGYECVGANGGNSYATPHLDALARSGTRFTQCHVPPLCTPTRVMLMTGQSNKRNYISFGELERSQQTFAHLFQKAGYATAMVGKWQLGRVATLPRHFGFDEHCLWQLTRRPSRYRDPGLEINGVEKDFTAGAYGPDLVQDYALDFITRHQERPFFLYYASMLTHDPFEPTPTQPNYGQRGGGQRRNPANFKGMVEYMDGLVGKLVAHLEALKLRENTIIVFLGDNGTSGAITSQFSGADFRGGKGTTTHRGTHVPAMVSWPTALQAGQVSADLVDASDILPTLSDLAALPLPSGIPVDGRSFAPQLRGEQGQPREWLYCYYRPLLRNDRTSEFAQDAHYKLYRDGRFYDLQADLDETQPLAPDALTPAALIAKTKLEQAIAEFADVRPAAIEAQTGQRQREQE